MSAAVESMVYVGKMPWHGLGTRFEEGAVLTSREVMDTANLNWTVEVAPIVTNDKERTSVDEWRVSRRTHDQAVLGIVKKNWRPIQNRDAFAMFDKIIAEKRVTYDTAGSLLGGSKVFINAKLPGVVEVGKGKDPVERYLLFSNPHDGCKRELLFTPVRTVCANTLALALSRQQDDGVTSSAPRCVIHAVNANDMTKQMKEAERVMAAALRYYERFGDFANFLASKQADVDVVETVIETVFPANRKGEVTDTIQEHRSAIDTLFTDGAGHQVPGTAGTAWALVNAFAEYADHGFVNRGKKAKSPGERAYSIWMGGAKGLKSRANKIIRNIFV